MAKVIFIGSDRNIFEEGSVARARMIEYGTLFEELHIVVFTQKLSNLKTFQLSTNTWVYPTRSWCKWFYPFDAYRIAKKIVTDSSWVISAQDPFEAGLAARWAVEKTGAKLHIQVHTDFLSPFFKKSSLLNRLRVLIARRVLPKADGIRVVSKRIKESLDSRFKIQDSRTKILPIFVEKPDISKVVPYDVKKEKPNWTFVILSVGRLEKEKNFVLMLRVMRKVCDRYPHTGLMIVGDGKERNKLEALIESFGLSKNIIFFGQQKNTTPFYTASDLYLQTSNYEGFGLSLIEAAYVGLPIVMTDVGSARWLFHNGENAKICPVGDEFCLTRSIIWLIEDNQDREIIIGNLKNGFDGELSKTKKEYLDKYKKTIGDCFVK